MPDISPLLHFSFWDPVYNKLDDSDFPSDSTEGHGHWVGIAENVGHAMTYKILTDDTKKVIYRSNVHSALTKEDRNKRVDLLGGEEVASIIKSSNDEDKCPRKPMLIFDPTDLVGRTFLMDPQENGERYHTKILEVSVESEEQLAKHPDHIKFVCSVNDDMYEEILTHNEILEYIPKSEEQDADQAIMWKFKHIAGHQGPLKKGNPGYNESKFNVLLEWETGESMYEPLDVIAANDPVTCAIYAKEKGLLNEPGWRRFKSITKCESRLLRMTNQAKLHLFRCSLWKGDTRKLFEKKHRKEVYNGVS